MTYNDWIMAVVIEDLGLSEDEIMQLEDILEGGENDD